MVEKLVGNVIIPCEHISDLLSIKSLCSFNHGYRTYDLSFESLLSNDSVVLVDALKAYDLVFDLYSEIKGSLVVNDYGYSPKTSFF